MFAFVVVENSTLCKARGQRQYVSHQVTAPAVGAAWESADLLKEKLAAFSEFKDLYEINDWKTAPLMYFYQYPVENKHIALLRNVMTAFVLSKSWMRKFFMAKWVANRLSTATPDYREQLLTEYRSDLENAIVFREKCELNYNGCSSIAQTLGTLPLLNRVNFEAVMDAKFNTFAAVRGCKCSAESIETCQTGACTALLLPYVARP